MIAKFLILFMLSMSIDAFVVPQKDSVKASKSLDSTTAACSINVNSDLMDPQPLLMYPDTNKFFYPQSSSGIIYMELNEQIELYCSSAFSSPSGAGTTIIATCTSGNKFSFNGNSYNFMDFYCTSYPSHTARRTGNTCYGGASEVEVGFVVGSRFLKTYEVCHSEVTEETHYVKYQLTPASNGYQTGFPRPSFIIGDFYNKKNVDSIYTRNNQRVTISGILESSDLALSYIEETSDVYLARGHLAAKVDFIFGSQQRASFYFINAAPQWQRFNALNWVAVEDGSRDLAANRNIELDAYSGTFGVMQLADTNSVMHGINLYVNGATNLIPVPKLYYRILVNNADNSGIVLIGVNNYHATLEEIKKDYIVCTDISDQITYISWKKDDLTRGFSYACEVNEFLKAVPHISGLNVKSVLI